MKSGPASALVCFALPLERKFLKKRFQGVRLLTTGIGAKNTQLSLTAALHENRPELVLTCGFAGGLNPRWKIGEILVSTESYSPLQKAFSKVNAHFVDFLCSPRMLIAATDKTSAWKATGAEAVEMESGVIREICRQQQIPSATCRVISDCADEDLPLDFNQFLTPSEELNMPKLIWHVVTHPSKIRQLMAVQKNSKVAARSLGRFLEQLLSELGFQ